MLVTKNVRIKLNPKTINWYWDLGYCGTTNQEIIVDITHLKPTSHYVVECLCDVCGRRKNLPYKSYILFLKKENKYFCHKCSMIKKKKTCLERYGVEYSLQDKNVREKIKKTCIEKYGSECYLTTNEYLNNEKIKEQIKEKNINSGRWISEKDLTPFLSYKRKCRTLTDKNKKRLFLDWDGYDFYDDEYIKPNLSLHFLDKRYPTIDHKISVFYGYKNNIDPEIISSIENLVITKRSINSSKRMKIKYEKISNN